MSLKPIDFKDVRVDELFIYKDQEWQKYDEDSAILSDPLKFEPYATVFVDIDLEAD